MAKNSPEIEATKRLMGALGRMPPKRHDEMKIGDKNKRAAAKSPAKKRVSSKPKTA